MMGHQCADRSLRRALRAGCRPASSMYVPGSAFQSPSSACRLQSCLNDYLHLLEGARVAGGTCQTRAFVRRAERFGSQPLVLTRCIRAVFDHLTDQIVPEKPCSPSQRHKMTVREVAGG